MNAANLIDFYKTSHRVQYPAGTNLVYSNWTPRKARDNTTHVVNFGLQYFIKKYLQEEWNNSFFFLPKSSVLNEYKRRMDSSLGEGAVALDHLEYLHDLGYLPIRIKSLPEGVLCPLGVPMFTLYNTDPKCFWLTNYLETIMSCTVWGPCTSATAAYKIRSLFNKYAAQTNKEGADFTNWQGHDFSMRGMFGLEAAEISGAGHLLSFLGTDTIPAIDFLEKYYGARNTFVGGSVAATEHSCMSLGTKEGEFDTFARLILEVHPKGILSIVSDTWNLWDVLTKFLPRLKNEIMERDGKVVIRPDSGDPIKIVCGNPDGKTVEEQKGVIQLLWEVFGGTISKEGYKVLHPSIGCIYGDGINYDRADAILSTLQNNGFASTNIVFGIGSYTYQLTTRDQYGFAMKATYGEVNGEPRNIYKDPVTDDGLKKSAKGLICVLKDNDYYMQDECTWEEEAQGELKTVFENGKLLINQSLSEIRERLWSQ